MAKLGRGMMEGGRDKVFSPGVFVSTFIPNHGDCQFKECNHALLPMQCLLPHGRWEAIQSQHSTIDLFLKSYFLCTLEFVLALFQLQQACLWILHNP